MNHIAEAHGLWYEGNSSWMQLIQQHGLLLPAEISGITNPQALLFREDRFDAATRIRCGRIYQRTHGLWTPANVSPKPYQGFHINALYTMAELVVERGAIVALGRNGAQSHWVVVLAERAEDVHYVTLKSKTYFGVLPEVNRGAIPVANRQDILQALEAVVEAAPIQAPQPVIDACRNAACHMITARIPESNPTGKRDLGKLVTWLLKNGERQSCADAASALVCLLEASASHLINRLHSRAKANAAAEHGTRPVSRQDANLAVDAIAFLLQDFGWAEAGE
ncbi:MAG: hypothetical protein GJU76_10380 [Gallionella sp.]|jgi:hypothetical protein|nr:hypothetical protein [Gallionella sp.]